MVNKTVSAKPAVSKAKKGSVELPTVKEMLEAGVHFGHETKRWNPNFRQYIFDKKGEFHIIDLEKTLQKLEEALNFLVKVAGEGNVLIIGTKRQARDIVKETAANAGSHFVVNRWVGGLVTNYDIVGKSMKRLQKIEENLIKNVSKYSQQRLSVLRREWGRLDRLFGGVKHLNGIPKAIVMLGAHYEKMALREAKVAKVPVVALVDSNTDPSGIDYPIPANDDALKSIEMFCKYFAKAIRKGNKGKGVRHDFIDLSTIGIKEEDLTEKAKSERKKIEEKEKTLKKESKAPRAEKVVKKTRTQKPVKKITKKRTTVKKKVVKTKKTKTKTKTKPKKITAKKSSKKKVSTKKKK